MVDYNVPHSLIYNNETENYTNEPTRDFIGFLFHCPDRISIAGTHNNISVYILAMNGQRMFIHEKEVYLITQSI